MRRVIFMAFWLACVGAYCAAAQSTIYGYDLQGRPITRLSADQRGLSNRPIVLFFVATDCPISNRYVPEMQRLEKEFTAKGVTFWLVYPNATETADGILRHNAAYGLTGTFPEDRVLFHPQPKLMALAPATITIESAVLVRSNANGADLKSAYLGRLDDRYIDIGRERPQATRHDLERAIMAAVNHEAVEPPGGPPVGCGIITEAALHPGAGKP